MTAANTIAVVVVVSFSHIWGTHAWTTVASFSSIKSRSKSTIVSLMQTSKVTSYKHALVLQSNRSDEEDEVNEESNCESSIDSKQHAYVYKPPKFSNAFRQHMESIKGKFPTNDDEGVDCTGEPAMDPSRMVMDDGLDSEYLSDFE